MRHGGGIGGSGIGGGIGSGSSGIHGDGGGLEVEASELTGRPTRLDSRARSKRWPTRIF